MYWSYILMAVGVLGLYFVTCKMRLGWVIGIFAQILWVAYAIVTHQYGFIISALVYGIVNYIGLRNFGRVRSIGESKTYVEGMKAALRVVDEKKSWAYSSAKILDMIDEEKKARKELK